MTQISRYTAVFIATMAFVFATTSHAHPGDPDYNKAEKLRLQDASDLHIMAALSAYRRACKAKHGAACWRIGKIFGRKAANGGKNAKTHANTQQKHFTLACKYRFNEGCASAATIALSKAKTRSQKRKAKQKLRKACKRGSGSACYTLIKDKDKTLTKRSRSQKRRWQRARKKRLIPIHAKLSKSCQKGLEMDCYLLAYLHFQGEPKKRPKRAVTLFQRACKLQSADGCDFLALLHGNGLGVARNLQKARALHKKACDLQLADGCTHFAGMVMRGLGGPKELGIARDTLEKACKWSHPQACLLLGEMVIRGEGGDRDVYKAFKLYLKSCKLKQPQACSRVKALKPILQIGKKKPSKK